MVNEFRIPAIVLLTILSATSSAQESIATALFQTDLPDIEGREAVVLEVEYPPGVASASHRHNAHTFVYVLEGTVVMQVAGGEQQTLVAGQTFYESPDDVHTVSRNASDTEPAKILVFFIKMKDAPASELVKD
ncbi:MAG: cupin domain-containing protein [Proteobacteria bacterium]|nr:cupin domain-containing protein [Pseudomonadota bacterium]